MNHSTIRRPSRHNINVVHAKFGHNKLFKLFTSVAITNDSTSTAKMLIDCEATIDFVSRAYLTRHKITASLTGKELVISFPNDEIIHQLYEQYKKELFTDELPPGLPVSRGEFDHKIKIIDD